MIVLSAGLVAFIVPGRGTPQAPADPSVIRHGGQLYQRYCAVCHGTDGSGVAGVAPTIQGFSVAAIDLTMRTGRMPLADPLRGVRERTLTDGEREAVVAYLRELLGLEGELPEPPPGQAARGRAVYAIHCAQCHGASGRGGVAGDGIKIPELVGLDPVTIAAATREGPFQMPRFGPRVVSDQQVGDIAAFLDEDIHQPTSPLGLAELSKFEVVGFATLLAVALVLVCAWAGGAKRRRDTHPEKPAR